MKKLLIALALACALPLMAGCFLADLLPEDGIEFCLYHPEYGKVCVGYDGKIAVTVELDGQATVRLEAWVDETLGRLGEKRGE